jgi:TIM-barrel protein
MTVQTLFDPPVALASLSGQSDAEWAQAGTPYAGAAFLGGIAIDGPTRQAARAMVERDREEFLPPDPIAFVDAQLDALADAPIRPGFNVRTTSLGPLRAAARVCRDNGAILEVNAHCRQDEMCAVGCGERLLRDTPRLREYVATAAETGATVSVKVRTEVDAVDLPALAATLADAGADAIHVDAMDSESVVGDVVEAADAFVIANNGVRDAATVHEYLDYGADAVSVGRPSDDPAVLARVREATEAWFDAGDGAGEPADAQDADSEEVRP